MQSNSLYEIDGDVEDDAALDKRDAMPTSEQYDI